MKKTLTKPVQSRELLGSIVNVFRNTPRLDKSYMCHGELHFYSDPDYDLIKSKIATLLEKRKRDKKGTDKGHKRGKPQ